MQRTRDWRRAKTKAHKERKFLQAVERNFPNPSNGIIYQQTREEHIHELRHDCRKRIPRWLLNSKVHGNSVCDYCAAKKIKENLDEHIHSWYAYDGEKLHTRSKYSDEDASKHKQRTFCEPI